MVRAKHDGKLPGFAHVRVAALVIAAALLGACAETSLSEAPIIDRSTRPAPDSAPMRAGQVAAAGSPAQVSAEGMYTVQKGDTLVRIATTFHCDVQDLARWNGIGENGPIAVGQRLRVRPPTAQQAGAQGPAGAFANREPVEPAEAEVHAIAAPGTSAVETRSLDAAPVSALSAGAVASATDAASSSAGVPAAGLVSGGGAAQAANAVAPGSSSQVVANAAANSPPADASRTTAPVTWIWPLYGRVTVKFDPVHSKGIDIAVDQDAKVVAVADGEVSYTGSPRDYGNLVILKHPDGLLSVYARNKTILVTQGQAVTRGQPIATAGKTDGATPSLHFEARRKGVPVDPLGLLPAR